MSVAYTTVTEELAARYPKLKGRVGETITAEELQAAQREAPKPSETAETPAAAPRSARAKKEADKDTE
jgi:hypothetical protein